MALVGDTETFIVLAVLMDSDVLFEVPRAVAVICALVLVVAEFTCAVNFVLDAPAGTDTFEGIVPLTPETE